LQHNLKVIMLTSIYVACKVEENYVSAEEFGKGMHEDASRVLNAELTLLAGLSFQLVTYSPYRSIQGFRHDMEEKLGAGEKIVNLDGCGVEASKFTDKQMLTDAPLMHSPGKLALSALRSAARALKLDGVLEYVRGVESDSSIDSGDSANLSQHLDAIDGLVELGGVEPKEEVVKDIDRKLKVWRTATNSKGTEGEGREGKRHKSASKQSRNTGHDQEALEQAALDGP
jgi:cyclin H